MDEVATHLFGSPGRSWKSIDDGIVFVMSFKRLSDMYRFLTCFRFLTSESSGQLPPGWQTALPGIMHQTGLAP
jgi:hypothetical protein